MLPDNLNIQAPDTPSVPRFRSQERGHCSSACSRGIGPPLRSESGWWLKLRPWYAGSLPQLETAQSLPLQALHLSL